MKAIVVPARLRQAFYVLLHALWWTSLAACLIVSYYSHEMGIWLYPVPCSEGCGFFQLSEEMFAQLAAIGVSPALYGGLTVVVLAIQNLSSWLMGFLVYRYGWKDHFCIVASMFLVITGTIFSTDDLVFRYHPFVEPIFFVLNAVGSLYVFVLFLLPRGRFSPRWTMVPGLAWLVAEVVVITMPELPVLSMNAWPFWFRNVFMLVTHGALVVAYYQIYGKGPAEQRRQMIWFAVGMLCYAVGGVSGVLVLEYNNGILRMLLQVVLYIGLFLLPFSVGVIVLEKRGRHLAVPYNRTLVYLVLSIMGVMGYVLLVGAAGLLFQGRTNGVVSLLLVGLAAVLFQPLREWVQRSVNVLVYGERNNPYQVLSGLSRRLEGALTQHSLLPDIVEATAQVLRVPYTALEMQTGDGETAVIASYGKPDGSGGRVSSIPLSIQGELVGRLIVGTDHLSEVLPGGQRDVLDDLIRQLSIAVQAERLTAELQRSRERLVSAREEERRRLRRDLHDGLGSGLASMTLRLDEALLLYESEPERSRQALETVQAQLRESIADIRRLVYALRPPALDEFGLAFALQELVLQIGDGRVKMELEGVERGLRLPAAVEVAVYRIVQEALTNVVRHAGAAQCVVRLVAMNGQLRLTIRDDGAGLPEKLKPGIGIRSMKERAEELGGSCALASEAGRGTTISVELPIAAGK
ncbi:sensor histidine kinase [Paenibacillus chartarius]|uniref:Oxygen sensor histidine kinase NreB n=1 Tax=Paenibacillus chartarius TaxID=747481 RepID=A0ABV6DMU7_9BACL